MGDGKQDPRMTPVPSNELMELTQLLIRTDQNVTFLKDELIPPLAKDTREARDKARAALGKIDGHLRDTDAHVHGCLEGDRQLRQDTDIGTLKSDMSETKAKTGGISKLVWWLMGIAVTVALVAGGFAVSVRVSSAENAVDIEDNAEDIDDNEESIKTLTKVQQEDRETYLRVARDLPKNVTKAARSIPPPEPTIDDMEDAADDLPLSPREQRQLLDLLGRARKRGNGHGDGGRTP
jgi:hypothetical protein